MLSIRNNLFHNSFPHRYTYLELCHLYSCLERNFYQGCSLFYSLDPICSQLLKIFILSIISSLSCIINLLSTESFPQHHIKNVSISHLNKKPTLTHSDSSLPVRVVYASCLHILLCTPPPLQFAATSLMLLKLLLVRSFQ